MQCNHVAASGKQVALLLLLVALVPVPGKADSSPQCQLGVSPQSGTIPWGTTAVGACGGGGGDAGAKITRVSLNWGDGSKPVRQDGASIRAQHTYSAAGAFTVVLTGQLDQGPNPSASAPVTSFDKHKSRNSPPDCNFSVSPQSGAAPLSVRGSGSCKDTDGDKFTASISWGDGASSSGTSGAHTYSSAGNYNAVLAATDTAGKTGTASAQVRVGAPKPTANQPPTCSLLLSSASGSAPLAVNASASCSDPENDISSVLLDFGDGFYVGAGSGAHIYGSAGTFIVRAMASDTAGNVSPPATQTVTVSVTPSLYAGISNGQVAQYDKFGNRLATLNSGLGGSMTGMAFDAGGTLYATAFTAAAVAKFSDGAAAGTFGSQYNCKPESIAFDNAGNAYVGQAGCSHLLLKFDAYGNLVNSYNVATEQTGSDWIDIAPDQCTLYYASEGPSVLRYNVCNKQQLPPLTSQLKKALSMRLLPDGGAVVADLTDIVRVDAHGTPVMTYDAAGEDCWASLTLDDDGLSFWAADYCTSDIARFSLSSPSPVLKFKSGTPPNTVFGVAVRSPTPATSPAGPLVASPPSANIAAGQAANFPLAFSPADSASGQTFAFSCANLPVGAQCAFSPGSVTANGAGLTSTLTISTHAATAALLPFAWNTRLLALLLGPTLPLLLIPLPRRPTRKARAALAVLVLFAACLMFACGGGSSSSAPAPTTPTSAPTANGATPTGTYSILVRVTSGNLQSSTPVTLRVQ